MAADRSRELDVFLSGQFAGRIYRERSNLRYEYDDAYRRDPMRTPLSVSMPLSVASHPHRTIRPWIAGLLPDSTDVLSKWARRFRVGDQPFYLLGTQVGLDCPGAVQFVPSEPSVDADLSRSEVEWLTDRGVADRIKDLERDSTSWLGINFDGRFSLAGAQAKTALRYEDGRWGVPMGAAATTHILKPAIAGLDDHDLNEHLCLRAARRIGLNAAISEVVAFEDERVIVVERYDRRDEAGTVVRIHQEDLCQALSVDPGRKYQQDGGPTPRDIAALIRDVMAPGRANLAVRQFTQALIFNWAIGGTDAHAKNYSLLLDGDLVNLAPIYDVASALPYADSEKKMKMAMKVGSDYYLETIRPQLWPALAKEVGLPAASVQALVVEVLDRIPQAFAEETSRPEVVALNSALPARLSEVVAARVQRCRRSLD